MNIREAHKIARVNCETVIHCIDNIGDEGMRVEVVMAAIESLTLISLALGSDTQSVLTSPEISEEFRANRDRFYDFVKSNKPCFDTLVCILDDLQTATFRVNAALVCGH